MNKESIYDTNVIEKLQFDEVGALIEPWLWEFYGYEIGNSIVKIGFV